MHRFTFDDGKTIDEIPLETYVGPATILDLREKLPGSSIQRADIAPFADRIEPGDIILLNTGGGRRRANNKEFLTEYVYLDGEAAQFLVDHGSKGSASML
jgi:kynurenine formamidase